MKIFINGQTFQLTKTSPQLKYALSQFLTDQQADMSFAVALNGDFIEKSKYEITPVNANDSIDVLFPIVGG